MHYFFCYYGSFFISHSYKAISVLEDIQIKNGSLCTIPPNIEEGEHAAVSSAKTAGIIMGILVPILIIVLCCICYCRKMSEKDTKPNVFYANGMSNQMHRNQHSIPLNTLEKPPGDDGDMREETLLVKGPYEGERIEVLNVSPKIPHRVTAENLHTHAAPPEYSSFLSNGDRASPEGDSEEGKVPTPYDGVYYTGEPLPGRPDVKFNENPDEDELPPSPATTTAGNGVYVSTTVSV